MKKVYISRYSRKGECLLSAIGFVDLETKTLYIPKVGKKGTTYIDEVVVNYINPGKESGYFATEIFTTKEGLTFTNTYCLNELKEGEAK